MAVQETLASPGFARHASHTLILTGAGAQLKGLLAYAEHVFHDKRVRLAYTQNHPGTLIMWPVLVLPQPLAY